MITKIFPLIFCLFYTIHIGFAQDFYLTEQQNGLNSNKSNVNFQDDSLKSKTQVGEIIVVQDQRIDSLIKKHSELNANKKTIEGYRVQISLASGANSRKASNDAKAAFLSKYSDVDAYIVHHAPNFKVRVGDFRTKLEASKFLNQVKKDFPGAFIVKDDISLPKL